MGKWQKHLTTNKGYHAINTVSIIVASVVVGNVGLVPYVLLNSTATICQTL